MAHSARIGDTEVTTKARDTHGHIARRCRGPAIGSHLSFIGIFKHPSLRDISSYVWTSWQKERYPLLQRKCRESFDEVIVERTRIDLSGEAALEVAVIHMEVVHHVPNAGFGI